MADKCALCGQPAVCNEQGKPLCAECGTAVIEIRSKLPIQANTGILEERIVLEISRKKAMLEMAGLVPRGILIGPDEYDLLRAWAVKTSGISGNPDRLMGLPLWQVDPRRTSKRIGFPDGPMVMI